MTRPSPHTAHTGHLSRAARAPEALATDYFRLDERSRAQLVHTATGLARLLTYYDAQNRPHGPRPEGQGAWEAFFRHDLTFLLAEIASVDAALEYRATMSDTAPQAMCRRVVMDTVRIWDWRDRAREMAVFAAPDSLVADVAHTLSRPDQTELTSAPFTALRRALDPLEIEARAEAARRLGPTEVFAAALPDPAALSRAVSAANRATAQVALAAETYLDRALAERRNHPGHLGLFLAFVDLLQKAQADLNRMTDRHLEFYFREVLRSAPQPARPDSTHVTFALAPGARALTLEAGTPLVAGSGAGPEAAIFELDRAVEVTAARVAHIRAVAVQRNMALRDRGGAPFVEAVDVYPVANSEDGRGAPLADPDLGWSPFGPGLDAPSHVGFALAAPILELAGGQRDITVTLACDPKGESTLARALAEYEAVLADRYQGAPEDTGSGKLPPDIFAKFLAEAVRVSITTATGWHPVSEVTLGADPDDPDALRLRLSVPATAPPLASHPDTHPEPVLRVVLNPAARAFAYSPLHRLRVLGATLAVQVTDLTTLKMETDIAPVAPGKPFAPFGPMPLPRARLTVAAPELARKQPSQLRLCFHWTGLPLPPETFASHYAGYAPKLSETDFRASLARSDGASWHPLPVQGPGVARPERDAPLFGIDAKGGVATETAWHVPHLPRPEERSDPAASAPLARPDTRPPGTLRVELTGPRFGFGQRLYPELIAAAAMKPKPGALSKALKAVTPKALAKDTEAPPPRPPLLPMLTGVGLSYRAAVRCETLGEGDPIAFYNLMVHGPMRPSGNRRLLRADLDVDGYLMIGLERTRLPETVSLFFDIRDSLAESWAPGDPGPRPGVCWYYLGAGGWREVSAGALREDTTHGLTTRGVVEIALPQTAQETDQFSDAPLVWLSVALRGNRRRFGRIVDITTHGVRATRRITAAPGAVTAQAGAAPHLPAGQITRFLAARPAIAKITQPVPSSGGRAPERDAAFRVRLSERLGHKMRAQRPMDYARMVLQEFDEIGDVRVLPDGAGGVEVVVAPVRAPDRPTRFPRVPLHLRAEIAAWLAARSSLPVARIDVRNPSYETIRVQAHLVPRPGSVALSVTDVTAHAAGLIAPWMQTRDAPMPIGQARLDVAMLLQHLRAMPGLEEVLGFSVLHVFRTRRANGSALGPHGFKDSARLRDAPDGDRAAVLLGATPSSVFVPARRHLISILPPRTGIGDLEVGADFIAASPAKLASYSADPASLPLRPSPAGIGNLTIGEDLILTRLEDTRPPAFAPDTRHHALDAVFLVK